MLTLRGYQTDAIEAFCASVEQGTRRSMVILPTGCGKTITGLSLAKEIGARTLWIAHREELITQPLKAIKLVWPDVNAGVVKADRDEWARDFVFASVQTASRPKRLKKLKDFDLVVIDEAHHAAAKSYRNIIEHLGCFRDDGPPLLGLTATPERGDSMQLEGVFDGISYHYTLRKAVESGYLVNVEMVRRAIDVDLDAVGCSYGDFRDGELDQALLESGIVEEAKQAVCDLARDKKTIIFTVSVRQAHLISTALRDQGLRADYVSGSTPSEKRKKILRDLASGDLTHVVNCMVLTEGFDEPSVECIVMARPTKSKPLYVQCVGRGLRIAPGKERCLIIDLVGISSRHTLIQAPVIFGVQGEDTKRQKSEATATDGQGGLTDHAKSLLLSQVKGAEDLERSSMHWLPASEDVLALNCGGGGTILMKRIGDEGWMVEVIGRGDRCSHEHLTTEPVDQEFAQGIAEDYARRAHAVYLSDKSARWRDAPATEAQKRALRKWKIKFHEHITKGEASDLMTKASATSWRNEPATSKQIHALRRRGFEVNPATLTKGQAGRLMAQGYCRRA